MGCRREIFYVQCGKYIYAFKQNYVIFIKYIHYKYIRKRIYNHRRKQINEIFGNIMRIIKQDKIEDYVNNNISFKVIIPKRIIGVRLTQKRTNTSK